MNITIVHYNIIPVTHYGGTERVIWYLGKELSLLGHNVTYLVEKGSQCNFATIKNIDHSVNIWAQIPENTDVIHFQHQPGDIERAKHPYVVTMHGNANKDAFIDNNTVFVSKNHAERYSASTYVYNGLDWDDYLNPTFSKENYFHFLAKAAWRIKNVKGAINVVKKAKNEHLKVLGGDRFNFKMGMRFTLTPKASCYGMVGGKEKNQLLNKSKGLIFPVLWHEPFGLAIIESLYYGCPVFATPYGSLNELINKDVGYLSNNRKELTHAIKNIGNYSQKSCNEYAIENFNAKKMALSYIEVYHKVANGNLLHTQKPKIKNIQTKKFLDWFE